jgi:cytochrome oxidase assembly protein ShyY1
VSLRRSRWIGWLLALLGIALFARLGFWQLARMHEKQRVLADVGAVLATRRPQPLAAAADSARARAYDWSSGRGRFATAPAVLLDNQERDGRPGVRVYRVFEPVGAAPLLVELGWLPVPPDRTMPRPQRPAGPRVVSGLLAPPPSAGLAAPVLARQPDGNLLAIALDLPTLRRALHRPTLASRVLKLDPALPFGYPRDLEVLPNTLPPSRHLGYAVQWFGLALAVLVTALVLTFRTPRPPRNLP